MGALGKKLRGAGLVALIATALAAVLWAIGALDVFEQKTWDWREALLAKPGKATDKIALILLDQRSLDWGRKENQLSWPWPRSVYAPLLSFAKRGGARSVGFDVIFSEASVYGVSDDQALGASIGDLGSFVGAVFLGDATGDSTSWPPGLPEPKISIKGLDRWLSLSRAGRTSRLRSPRAITYASASFPISDISMNARYLADVAGRPDSDGIYREVSLFSLFDRRVIPSMALAEYLAGAQGRPHRIEIVGPGIPGEGRQSGLALTLDRLVGKIDWLRVDSTRSPLGPDGRFYLRYRGPAGVYRPLEAAAVIQSELQIENGDAPNIDPSVLKDKYVFFGYSAPGLLDVRPTPVSGVNPGVAIHATTLDNLLSGDFILPVAPLLVVAIALAIALLAGASGSLASGAAPTVAVYVVALALPPAAGVLAYRWGFRLPVVMGELATIFSLTGTAILNYVTEGRQKRYIKGAFKQYLSPAVIEELIAHPERLRLGGERRTLSIFFSDLQGFTGLSEGLSPEDLTALLNEYLSAMTDIIQDEGGTIDKYEGDAIIAFWNAPITQEDHAARSVRAALRCQAQLATMRPSLRARVGKDLFVRVGINTGPAVVGNMGSRSRFDYTMLGDAVNLASRLEGINKQFKTFTMISEMTRSALGGAFRTRELSRVAVVGRKEPVAVYEPLLEEDYRARTEDLAVFDEALRAFYAGDFARAGGIFERLAATDPPAAAYAAKCRALAASPPADWQGVWVMTEK